MTLRSEFRKQLNIDGIELLLADSNSAYIEWLEHKVNAIRQHTEKASVILSDCECNEKINAYFNENPEFSIRDCVIAFDA